MGHPRKRKLTQWINLVSVTLLAAYVNLRNPEVTSVTLMELVKIEKVETDGLLLRHDASKVRVKKKAPTHCVRGRASKRPFLWMARSLSVSNSAKALLTVASPLCRCTLRLPLSNGIRESTFPIRSILSPG